MSIQIRSAAPADAPALLAIYAPYVAHTAITFEYDVPAEAEFARRIAETLKRYPYLVAEEDGVPVGYAYAGKFHDRAAYDWSVESTIYCAPDARGFGVGDLLYRALLELLEQCGYWNVYALVADPNPASEHIHEKLTRQITLTMPECDENCEVAYAISTAFIERIPAIQELLLKDLSANFEGDPAAYSKEEVLLSYPGMFAIFIYRIAHELYENKVAMIPRMMSEYAHSQTGIDINPGAKIGEYFFIDHGTGVVVGETTIIGDNVKLYQGATLGALSPAGMATNPNVRRHPKVGNNVVIYANSTLLGGATEIGDNVVVGGNAFLTSSVEPDTIVSVKNPEMTFRGKHHRG